MSSKCAWAETEKTHIQQHAEHALVWLKFGMKTSLCYIPQDPSVVPGCVISTKERCLVSSRSSTVKYKLITSQIALSELTGNRH